MINKTRFEIEKRAIEGNIFEFTPIEIMADICTHVKVPVSPEFINIVSKLPYNVVSSFGIDKDDDIIKYGLELGLEEYQINSRIYEVRNIMRDNSQRDKMNNIINAAYALKKEIDNNKPFLEDNSGLVH